MDFRPISLVSGVYKMIAKVPANKMTNVVEIISKPYNSFVQGKQIMDSVLIANKCVDGCTKSGVPRVLCKLDIEKSFDHINWKFFLYMLRRCGFGFHGKRIAFLWYVSPLWLMVIRPAFSVVLEARGVILYLLFFL
jgi:hypothetical protein